MKYLLAVSGGVDSVVLLHKFLGENIVVAHFDHGIRAESGGDAEFVRDLCREYGVEFVLGGAKLGAKASESTARAARYAFLRETLAKTGADVIVTAHHQDDLLETIVINLIRGTGWRGLAPMHSNIVRPLLKMSKSEIVAYALQNGLEWVEDATNDSPRYLRNRVRQFLLKLTPEQRRKIIKLYQKQAKIRAEIDQILRQEAHQGQKTLDRAKFSQIPAPVAVELLKFYTGGLLTGVQLNRVWRFINTAEPAKKLLFGQKIAVQVTKNTVIIKKYGKIGELKGKMNE
jgi:tRNA(Ile)-lysidine synthase